jgi:hypothetical protein
MSVYTCRVGWWAAVAVALSGSGCQTLEERSGRSQDAHAPALASQAAANWATEAADQALAPAYPPGRWRLASSDEMDRLVLWVSHILIRHSTVPPAVVSFELGDWTPAPAAPARTRRQAFDSAQQLAQRLQANPAEFSTLARQLSEDVATREQGGSMGGICASNFLRHHAAVLDALSAIRPGEISRVVETVYGFHVFTRRAPPPEATISGARIVIGYDEAPWLKTFLARRPVPQRSRQAALALAQTVYTRARAGDAFPALVEAHSDHEDALRQGDFGAWSTRECTPFPREIEVLSQLAVGEVAPPIDSPFGVQILQRTAPQPREVFAMTTVEQRFDRSLGEGEAASPASVLRNVQQLARDVAVRPSLFEELQRTHCCAAVQEWPRGRGSASAERALALLRPGQVTAEPIHLTGAYALLRRVTPSVNRAAPAPLRFEFPAPDKPDLDHQVRMGLVNQYLSHWGRQSRDALGVTGPIADQLMALHDATGATPAEETAEQRVVRFAEFQSRVQALLGAELYGRYQVMVVQFLERELLNPIVPDDLRDGVRHSEPIGP